MAEPKPVDWVKSSRDTVAALVAAGPDPAFKYLRLLLRTMRTGTPTQADITGLEELVFDELIFESDEGVIPACVIESSESCHKTSEARIKAWKTRKSLKKDQADVKPIHHDITPNHPDVTLNESRESRETRTEREKESPQAAPVKGGKSVGYSDEFESFWQAYPTKTGKGLAWESWKKRKAPIPEISQVLKSVEDNKASFKWRKDGGQFVPMPSTWINQRRWEDEAGSTQDTSRPNRFIDDTPPQGLKTGNYNGETF